MNLSRNRKQEAGFSLIEVLLTIVLLAIGFLVAGKMQVQGLRGSQAARMQASALEISAEMMDKMRNNPTGVANGEYDGKTTSAAAATTCPTSGCTPAQQAAKDLHEWSAHFIDVRNVGDDYLPSLPGTSETNPATASISNPVDDVYTIRVDWQVFSQGALVPESFVVSFIP